MCKRISPPSLALMIETGEIRAVWETQRGGSQVGFMHKYIFLATCLIINSVFICTGRIGGQGSEADIGSAVTSCNSAMRNTLIK